MKRGSRMDAKESSTADQRRWTQMKTFCSFAEIKRTLLVWLTENELSRYKRW
jgi:hypothetical protein